MSLDAYREAMEATARAPVLEPPPPLRVPRAMTITYYGCKEYLRRVGLITDGELVFHRIGPKRVTIAEIQQVVSERFDVPRHEMTSARRAREVARPRQVAMYLAKQLTPRSLPEIGRLFGGRDHTTVIHAVRQIGKLMLEDAELAAAVAGIAAELQASGDEVPAQ